MRDLKFRVWDEDHYVYSDEKWENEYPDDGDVCFGFENGKLKAWVSITKTPSDPLEAPYPSSEEIDSPIEQFTGLKDKNGIEAYFGQRLKDKTGTEYAIVWIDLMAAFWVVQTEYPYEKYTAELISKLEVHDNPEMVK